MPAAAPAVVLRKRRRSMSLTLALELGAPKLSLSMKFSPVAIFAFRRGPPQCLAALAREQVQLLLRQIHKNSVARPQRIVPSKYRADFVAIDLTQHIGLRADLLDQADYQLKSRGGFRA